MVREHELSFQAEFYLGNNVTRNRLESSIVLAFCWRLHKLWSNYIFVLIFMKNIINIFITAQFAFKTKSQSSILRSLWKMYLVIVQILETNFARAETFLF